MTFEAEVIAAMGDITLGSIVIPSALGAALGSTAFALWHHLAGKELRRLESRLRKQEETYRIAQSPRVESAIALWSALGEYERSFDRVRSPVKEVKTSPGTTPADWDRLADEHNAALRREHRQAWSTLRAARDRAEVLLPPPVFAAFDALFRAYAKAHETQWWMDSPGNMARQELWQQQKEQIAHAATLRPEALRALHAMLGWAAGDAIVDRRTEPKD